MHEQLSSETRSSLISAYTVGEASENFYQTAFVVIGPLRVKMKFLSIVYEHVHEIINKNDIRTQQRLWSAWAVLSVLPVGMKRSQGISYQLNVKQRLHCV